MPRPCPYSLETFTDAAGKSRWRLKAANGETLATSEAYDSPRNRTKTLEPLAARLKCDVVKEKKPREPKVAVSEPATTPANAEPSNPSVLEGQP